MTFICLFQVVQPITFEYRCRELVTNRNCNKRKRPTNENGVFTFYAVLLYELHFIISQYFKQMAHGFALPLQHLRPYMNLKSW